MININDFKVDKLILLITKIRAMISKGETEALIPYVKNPEFTKIFHIIKSFRDNPEVYKKLLKDEVLMNTLLPIFENENFKRLYEETLRYKEELVQKLKVSEPIINDYFTNVLEITDEKNVLVNVVHPTCITGTNDMQNEIFWGHNAGGQDPSYDITYIMHEAMHCTYPREKEWSDEQYGVCHSLIELAIDNELRNRLGGNNKNYSQGHKDGALIRKKLMPLWETFLSQRGGMLEFKVYKDEEFEKYMNLARSNNVQNMNFTELMHYCVEHYREYCFDSKKKQEKHDVGDER